MRIGLVTDTYLPRINGVVQSILNFTRQYQQRGHEVFVFSPAFPQQAEQPENVWRFPSYYLFFNPEDRLPNPWCKTSRGLLKKVPDLHLDIIHTQTPFTLGWTFAQLAKRLNLPGIHTYHTFFEAYVPLYFPIVPRFLSIPFARWYSRRFCNLHDQVVAPSQAMAERLRQYRVSVPIEIIPTGTDLDPFQNTDGGRMRYQLRFGEKDILLLTMGRVAREKNLPFLLGVLEKVLRWQPRARLVVAGQGPALPEVKAECSRRGLNDKVMFLGLLPREDWIDLYAAADLFLLASVTETQGLVLTEAMATGTPCVAVNAMGVKDVMANGGGLTVSLNIDEFAQAVNQLLTDQNFYAAKAAEAKLQAQAFSAGTQADKMLANYTRLIQSKKKLP